MSQNAVHLFHGKNQLNLRLRQCTIASVRSKTNPRLIIPNSPFPILSNKSKSIALINVVSLVNAKYFFLSFSTSAGFLGVGVIVLSVFQATPKSAGRSLT